jgi:hypothetical protein
LFDYRYIDSPSFWFRQGDAAATSSDAIRRDRYVVTYNMASSGGGQSPRPYMQTLRYGFQLKNAIKTDNQGAPVNLQVTGNTSFYQIDPVNGRIYFTSADEDRPITVKYVGMDPTTGDPIPASGQLTETGNVSIVTERDQIPVPIEQAVNESQMVTFLDPFNYDPSANTPRPGLIWMFWSSTRTGGPDIYFQTIAPKLTPVVASK